MKPWLYCIDHLHAWLQGDTRLRFIDYSIIKWELNKYAVFQVFTKFHWGSYCLGFPGGASGKEPTCQCRRYKWWGFCPWVRKIPWRRNGNPFQYYCLGNLMDRGAWWDPRSPTELDTTEATEHTHIVIISFFLKK